MGKLDDILKGQVEEHRTSVEAAEKAERLRESLASLGAVSESGRDVVQLQSANEQRPRIYTNGVVIERTYPAGKIDIPGAESASIELVLTQEEDDGIRIPKDPSKDGVDIHPTGNRYLEDLLELGRGIGMKIVVRSKTDGGEELLTKTNLGKIVGVDKDGNPIITVDKRDYDKKEHPDADESEIILGHKAEFYAPLNPESERYKQVFIWLYGTADTVEKEAGE